MVSVSWRTLIVYHASVAKFYSDMITWPLALIMTAADLAPIKTAADGIHKYFSLFLRENKTWCSKWILC